jgi:hypothetical protein
VTTLFASFLGYNPMANLLGPHALAALSASSRATVVGRTFFPTIIQKAFVSGLHPALDFATIICLLAAVTSWLRGGHKPSRREANDELRVDVLSAPDTN